MVRDPLPSGTTVRLVLVGCRCPHERLTAHAAAMPQLVEAVRSCGMTPLAQLGHDFAGSGHSLCMVLAESHLALHTYPEASGTVIVEISVCDHLRPNRERALDLAERLVALFRPERYLLEPLELLPRGEWRAGPGA